jgi:hypothetical protein
MNNHIPCRCVRVARRNAARHKTTDPNTPPHYASGRSGSLLVRATRQRGFDGIDTLLATDVRRFASYRLMTADFQVFDIYSENTSRGLWVLHTIHD